MREMFDHIKIGKALKHFIYPPRVDQNINGFEAVLKEVISQKLNGLLNRANHLKERKDFELRLITATTKRGSLEEYFWVSFAFHEFSEYYIIQKWFNYWLSIWYKVSPESLPKKLTNQLNRISQDDIERAKQTPIQDFYNGQLRRQGSRLVGLCPFHQEKTPSFNIYLYTNTCHCFGCQASGDSISFIQQTQNLTFPEAVRYLI